MTVCRAIYLMCDECGALTDVETMRSAADHRRDQGWVRRDGRDLCLRCQKLVRRG